MDSAEFDFIVVGAGASGCTVASRLSEGGMFRVLLIEAGSADRNLWVHIPLGVGKLLTNEKFVWTFKTEPEAELFGRQIYTPRGKLLGGSSSVNGMAWVRGEPAEFDHWRAQGNEGWSFDEILPYYKKLEAYAEGDPTVRGLNGPIKIINRGKWDPDPLSEAYRQACIEAGIPANEDYNGSTFEGVGYLQQNIVNGRRCSASSAYLRPARRRPNLTLISGATATRILFQGKRAAEVEYVKDGRKSVARVSREVIVAAGAIKSPQLLELSGIGSSQLLSNLGISSLIDLPGVGEHYCDHLQFRFTYRCTRAITINDIITNRFRGLREGLKYVLTRRGLLSGSSSTVHALLRSEPNLRSPDLKVQIALISGQDRYSRTKNLGIDPFSGFQIGAFKIRPESVGSVHIRNSDPFQDPAIRVNYLSSPVDIDTYKRAVRIVRNIAAQPALRPFISAETRPGPDITTDDELIEYIRRTGQTAWHGIGTCRMGNTREDVVDSRLRVHGVFGLRVVDISIMPTMASPNTHAPAILIGEKAAGMIREDVRSFS